MGFSLRKSFKLGKGTHLNLSSRGLSVSTGIKGFRINSRGSIYAGRGPLRFQGNLRTSGGRNSGNAQSSSAPNDVASVVRPTVGCLFLPVVLLSLIFLSGAVQSSSGAAWLASVALAVAAFSIYNNSSKAKLGYALYEQALAENDPANKLSLLERALLEYPQSGIKIALAAEYMSQGRWEEALKKLREIESNGNSSVGNIAPVVVAYIGTCLLRLEQNRDALEYFERTDEKKEYEGFMEILALKAEAFYGLREYDKAMAAVKTGLAKRSDDHIDEKRILRLWLAKLLHVTGQASKANSELKKVLSEAPDFEPAKELKNEFELDGEQIKAD